MKKYLILFLVFCFFTVGATAAEQELSQLIDGADLLTISEEAELLTLLNEISGELNAQIAIATTDTLDGIDIDTFINDLYDQGGYGYGANKSGVLLLVCMDIREYRILSNGEAGDAITEYEIDRIGEAFLSNLSGGNYADAFETYAKECRYYINSYQNGYGGEYQSHTTFDVSHHLLLALVIGLVVGGIVMLVLVGQLKSVRKQSQANAYIRGNSLYLTQSGDYFMYRNVTRTPKPKNNSSGGGGGGGSRHSGGGKF